MKKNFFLIITLCLILLMTSGCLGSSKDKETNAETTKAQSFSTPTEKQNFSNDTPPNKSAENRSIQGSNDSNTPINSGTTEMNTPNKEFLKNADQYTNFKITNKGEHIGEYKD